MVDRKSPFAHHFLEIAVAQGIAQVPPNAQEDEFGFELTPIEKAIGVHSDESAPSLVHYGP